MYKKLSIIIVIYNSENLIFDCLDSIFKFNDIGDSLEVIIVDNCSADQNKVFSKIRTDYSTNITLIKSSVNNGYGHGNNQGVQASTAARFIIMNPDVRIVEPTFQKVLAKFDEDQNIGMLGVRFTDPSNILYFKPEHSNLFRMLFLRLFIRFRRYRIEQMYFSGSFLVFDKQSFIDAGTFDENIFLYYEEADISNRIHAIGKKTVLSDDVYVLHLVHERKVNPFLVEIDIESLKYYLNKYHANLDKYISCSLRMYRMKYIVALILKNKIKAMEFLVRIKKLKNSRKR